MNRGMNDIDTLVWLDLETTGLDPQRDDILEIAVRVSHATGSGYHSFVGLGEQVVVQHGTAGLSSFILEMHTRNGLLAECGRTSTSKSDAESMALAYLSHWPGRLTLAGSSIHFDLGFLRVYMPLLASRFSHRLFDVSAMKLFCRQAGMPALPKAEAHRAMADVEESFAHWQACRRWVLDGTP